MTFMISMKLNIFFKVSFRTVLMRKIFKEFMTVLFIFFICRGQMYVKGTEAGTKRRSRPSKSYGG